MKIALIGYGKMGHIIERIARQRGHEIVSIIDVDNQEDFNSKDFASADVAIEFTMPAKAVDNYRKAWAAGVPVVSGTTGWTEALPELKVEIQKQKKTLFWSSNYSLGVNIFFELNRRLASIMNGYADYDVSLTEIHHTEKKDAPSGTAITLAEDVLKNIERKDEWVLGPAADNRQVSVTALRQGMVPGTHIVEYDSQVDKITIKHEAKSREGFALGAVVAAEFLVGKPYGYYTMNDLLKF